MKKQRSKLVVLSNDAGLYSTKRLVETGEKRFHTVEVVPVEIGPVITSQGVFSKKNKAVVLPRVSFESLQGALPHLYSYDPELLANSIIGIIFSHNKALTDMRVASKGSPVIPSVTFNAKEQPDPDAFDFPCIVKPLAGTQGVGVLKAENRKQLRDHIRTMKAYRHAYMVQRHVENTGDYRVVVVGYKAIAAMKRTQAEGDHRSNVHQGGTVMRVPVSKVLKNIAERAAKRMRLGVAGVDIVRCAETGKHYVLEVNSSPGLEGIEAATGLNIAGKITDYCLKLWRLYHGR